MPTPIKPMILDTFLFKRAEEFHRGSAQVVDRARGRIEDALRTEVLNRLCERGRIEPGEELLRCPDPFSIRSKTIVYSFPERSGQGYRPERTGR